MTTLLADGWTVADVLEHFGPVPIARIRQEPAPGTAVPQDVVDIEASERRLYELIDGVLVEKAMDYYEGYIAALLVHAMVEFVKTRDLGIVNGPDATIRLSLDQVRIPDVSFVSWARIPGGVIPREAMPLLVPDLAVEIISKGNTPEEMNRKLAEYFDTGVRLVWYVYPDSGCVRVYQSPTDVTELTEDDALDGGDVLAGFSLSLRELFAKPQKKSE